MNNRNRTILVGVAIGAATGLVAAIMWNQRAEEAGTTDITAGEGVKLGVLIVGLLRAVSAMAGGDDKKKLKR